MADPNDIYKDLTPSGQPVDEFGTAKGTAGFDPNSTGREAAAAAVEAARAASAQSAPITIASDSRADEWNATFLPGGENYSLTASQWNDTNPDLSGPLRDRRKKELAAFGNTRRAARDYGDTTNAAVSDTLAAHKDISSADFVRKLTTLDSTHPDYPTRFAELVATHPTAGGKLVDQVIGHQQNRREVFQKAVEKGGAAEYGSGDNPTPAFNTYVSTFAKTKDPVQAKASADRVMKDEVELDTAAKEGLLTETDFPKWNEKWRFDAASRPKVYNRDGTTNYVEAKKLIATRKGSGAGLKGQQDLIKEQDASIREFGKQLSEMDPTDPNYEKVHSLWQSALDARTARMKNGATNAPAAATGTPGPAPTPAPTPGGKPLTRTRGGFTYNLQPDGSYK